MNRKWLYAFVVALILIALVVVFWQSDTPNRKPFASSQAQSATQEQDDAPVGGSDPATPVPGATGSKTIDAEHKEDVRKGLEAIVEGLKQKGALHEVPPTTKQLQDAIQSKDSAAIHRAFQDAIYSPAARMSEAIPAIKAYLNSSEPYVRYSAAEALLQVGDQSGIDSLAQFISSDDAILQNGIDLRIEAARLLGKYGDERASTALSKLYETTKNGGVLNALARIQADNPSTKLLSEIEGRQSPGFVAFNLGLVGLPQGEPVVREALKNPQVPSNEVSETKIIAAWALAQNLNDASGLSYLSEAARPAIERQEKGSLSYDDSTKALKYLGSVQSPQAVTVMEQALDSQNPVAVRYATVNLLFNQPGGSQKAEQLILRELQTSPSVLGTELTMQIASKLDNPQIRAAAQSYAQRTGSDRWRYWGVERSNWPVQNWIYDYAVTLNP